ncbi:MAG: hypothetical protein R3F49_17060 [Planctomycetota bacterium]
MPALRFLALATLLFIVPAGAFLWHQQLARLESEARRVLRGPALSLVAEAAVTWQIDLAASTADQAWMHCQRQPRLTVAAPDGTRLRATARYLAHGGLPEVPAFVAQGQGHPPGTVPLAGIVAEARDGRAEFGPLWLSYLQPLEVVVRVEEAPSGAPSVTTPELAGEVSADYAFARDLDRSVFVAFACIGVLGAALFVLVERKRTFVAPERVGRGPLRT